MNTYQITINFKDKTTLEFKIDAEDDLKESIPEAFSKLGTLVIGEYIISKQDILYMRVEGDTLEEPSGK